MEKFETISTEKEQEETTIRSSAASEQGLRPEQQDFFIEYPDKATGRGFFAVADGMGGETFGQETAQCVIRKAARLFQRLPKKINLEVLAGWSKLLQQALDEEPTLQNRKLEESTGSTLTGIIVDGPAKKVWILHIGDSRAYVLSPSKGLQLLTKDHTLAQKYLEQSREEEIIPDDYSTLTRFLGLDIPSSLSEERHKIDISYRELEPGAIYLLCSDGFYRTIDEKEIIDIIDILKQKSSPQDKTQTLMQLAKKKGLRDNATLVVVDHVRR